MPTTTEVKSNRDRYSERLKAKYPDKEFADDEALFGQINDDYDGYEKELGTYREREKALSDLFASNPRSASFLTDWRNGEDPIVGLVRKFGDDFKAALEDPERQKLLLKPIRSMRSVLPKRTNLRNSIRRISLKLSSQLNIFSKKKTFLTRTLIT